jgi:hypothetical protein
VIILVGILKGLVGINGTVVGILEAQVGIGNFIQNKNED